MSLNSLAESRAGSDGVIAVGRAAPKQVGAHGSPEGNDRAALLIPVKVERRDTSRGISRGLIGPWWVTVRRQE